MQMPGFRPGKVPMSMVRKRYGEAVAAEVLEGAVNEATDRVLEERNLRPAMQPKLEVTKPGKDSDLEFTLELELLPEITLPELSDITLTKPVATVSDAAVDEVDQAPDRAAPDLQAGGRGPSGRGRRAADR